MVRIIYLVSSVIMIVFIIRRLLIKAVKMSLQIRTYEGKTEGSIIGVRETYEKKKNFSKEYYYYPTYRYTVNDITYEEEFPFHENKEEKLPIGEIRIIQYDEKNPKNFYPVVNKNAWFLEASKYTLSIVWIIATAFYIWCK
ncbi:DUF3592 domain-containing protein [Lacrimispora defluvii]|uniref:DUF3592 domain-containing protein n=1 Tax=Lacrimispora defluvii TaxID=2719233 RepID=A0ABX1VZR1_9FIRM|nr:hypothetical protein [Lacrimispora defluvii]NNJ32706.1 hypothetical protein [Lacrimispora defluvii]